MTERYLQEISIMGIIAMPIKGCCKAFIDINMVWLSSARHRSPWASNSDRLFGVPHNPLRSWQLGKE
jgi:hypothetical protein